MLIFFDASAKMTTNLELLEIGNAIFMYNSSLIATYSHIVASGQYTESIGQRRDISLLTLSKGPERFYSVED